ncbi:MAG: helix-turn-helix domain-containing protein [Rhodospirillaceae bacterium]
MRFTQHDFDDLLDFVAALYDHRPSEGYADRAMESLLKIIPADRVVYGVYEIERQAARLSMQPTVVRPSGSDTPTALSRLEHSFSSHPLFRYFLQTGDGRAQKTTQALTRADFQRHCRADAYVRELGAKYELGIFFSTGPGAVTVVLLLRHQRDFTERERGLMNRLYPHLVQAFRHVASLDRYCRGMDELVDMLEGPTSSVVVLAGDGRIRRWSNQAKTWIARYCRTPFPLCGDRLPQCFASWYRRQVDRMTCERSVTQTRDVLVVEKEGRQLSVQFIPDYLRDEHLLLLNEKRCDTPWRALSEYGLTPRESEVLAWVAKGKTNAEVGAILEMSNRTVQKHLEHIYQKLGVETRTTATIRALSAWRDDSVAPDCGSQPPT